MIRRREFLAGLSLAATLGCRRGPAPIAVGSRDSTEQAIVAEIAAQHLERRLGHNIGRRLRLGGSLITYQALQNSEIALYTEYTGSIITDILREQPSNDASIVLERARSEMRRTAQAELLDPLGFKPEMVAVIRSDDPRAGKTSTLSEASQVKDGWKIAVTFDFQQRSDGIPSLTQYRLPMSAPIRAVAPGMLFKALEEGQVSMIFTAVTDGALESGKWKALSDDRKLFTPQEACFLVRQSALEAEPKLRGAITELSGKISTDRMRKLNAQLDLAGQKLEEVAAAFLKDIGLA